MMNGCGCPEFNPAPGCPDCAPIRVTAEELTRAEAGMAYDCARCGAMAPGPYCCAECEEAATTGVDPRLCAHCQGAEHDDDREFCSDECEQACAAECAAERDGDEDREEAR
jgi:hypothetical protein